jgi:hypothetical protein
MHGDRLHDGITMTTSPDFAEHRTDKNAWCPATAQAVELVRALRHQLHEMTAQFAWVESQDVTRTNGPSHARCGWKQAALRRDIREAEVLIDRLERRYLSGDERTQQRPAGGQSRAMVGLQAK